MSVFTISAMKPHVYACSVMPPQRKILASLSWEIWYLRNDILIMALYIGDGKIIHAVMLLQESRFDW